jgi:pyruvate,water dikinase
MLHFIDLGGGVSAGMTSCDRVTPDQIESVPMKALWKRLSHPGINRSSAVSLDFRNLMTVMASIAVGEGGLPGGDSFAIVTEDYLNLSVLKIAKDSFVEKKADSVTSFKDLRLPTAG